MKQMLALSAHPWPLVSAIIFLPGETLISSHLLLPAAHVIALHFHPRTSSPPPLRSLWLWPARALSASPHPEPSSNKIHFAFSTFRLRHASISWTDYFRCGSRQGEHMARAPSPCRLGLSVISHPSFLDGDPKDTHSLTLSDSSTEEEMAFRE